MDWNQRANDCDRRVRKAYPEMLKAKRAYERYSKLWVYWSNRSIEAQRKTVNVKAVEKDETKARLEEVKAKMYKAFKNLTQERRDEILRGLKGATI